MKHCIATIHQRQVLLSAASIVKSIARRATSFFRRTKSWCWSTRIVACEIGPTNNNKCNSAFSAVDLENLFPRTDPPKSTPVYHGISQGAIAEILEALKLAKNLIKLELAVVKPQYPPATSPPFLTQNTALILFLLLEYLGLKNPPYP